MENNRLGGFSCGVFDLFHLSHALMLKECKHHCDYLIIALNDAENFSNVFNSNKNKPIFSLQERIAILQTCRFVDEVISSSSEDDLLNIFEFKKIF